jgi:hypothetical protein
MESFVNTYRVDAEASSGAKLVTGESRPPLRNLRA